MVWGVLMGWGGGGGVLMGGVAVGVANGVG